ncbi:hypothetical protein Cgig2_013183 [Carnegiea gigantea]|uniref:Pentatricopeptide repeat-containing protein n=1 Tax=Carnegiea gigantea TaxID=171969 RepID=A0A9Q1JKG5_9CARY|nr:hypothetical protein Cgig2_013183 [Carnegiea gigantea]
MNRGRQGILTGHFVEQWRASSILKKPSPLMPSGRCLPAVLAATTPQNSKRIGWRDHQPRHSEVLDAPSQLPPRFVGSNQSRGFSRIEDALHLFDEMTRKNPLPSLVHCTSLISPIVKMKHYDIVMSLLRRVELLGILHDVYSLAVLINCHCQLLGKLFKLGYSPDCVIFTTLINGFINVDELDHALYLLERILKQQNFYEVQRA